MVLQNHIDCSSDGDIQVQSEPRKVRLRGSVGKCNNNSKLGDLVCLLVWNMLLYFQLLYQYVYS